MRNNDLQPRFSERETDLIASTNALAIEADLAFPACENSENHSHESIPEPGIRIESEHIKSLQLLEGIEAVRKRPGMYIGCTDIRALPQLFKEIFDNAIDEALAGHCDRIDVILGKDRTLTVTDNGRGIGVDIDPQFSQPIAELVMTEVYADRKHRGNHKLSCSLHGVGVSCVNALSDWMETTIRRDGRIYRMHCERGVIVAPLEIVGTCAPADHGTTQQWLADSTIFYDALTATGELDYRPERLIDCMQRMAYLNKEVTITFHDKLNETEPLIFHYPHGIAEYVVSLNEGHEALHDDVLYSQQQEGETQVEIAIQYNQSQQENIYALVNTISLYDGGTHVTGFKAGFTRAINQYARKSAFLNDDAANFSGFHIRRGMTAIVSLRMVKPMFNSANKTRLTSPEIEGIVSRITRQGVLAFFEAHPQIAQTILEKIAE